MRNKLALINASNLHQGGGVQVAISFLHEISLLNEDLKSIHVIVSTEVNQGLIYLNINTSVFGDYYVFDSFGLKAFISGLNSRISKYDLVFTIFGPNYLIRHAKYEIVGFAQPWILNFNNPISKSMSFFSRVILKIKFELQWLFFLRADHYIVELEHVKKDLNCSKGISNTSISVVHNTVSSLYKNKDSWSSIVINKNDAKIALGIVSRDYPHKNIKILPYVAEFLKERYSLDIHFYVTLNDIEWAKKDDYFKKYVSNVGSLTPDQCPSFYEQMDGIIFPSLLECFSATPLEAMAMYKPLFASDRGFVRDVCADYAIYFDPLDINDIAFKIANYFNDEKADYTNFLQNAREHALNFSTAENRASEYLKIIRQNLEG